MWSALPCQTLREGPLPRVRDCVPWPEMPYRVHKPIGALTHYTAKIAHMRKWKRVSVDTLYLIAMFLYTLNSLSVNPFARRNLYVTGNAIAPTTDQKPRCESAHKYLYLLSLFPSCWHHLLTIDVFLQCALVCEKSPHSQESPAPKRPFTVQRLLTIYWTRFVWARLQICFCSLVVFLTCYTACPVGVVIAGCVSVQPVTAGGVVRQVVAGNVLPA